LRRLLIASYHFPPGSAVGGRRPARLARLLPDFGYQCDVICASPENAAEPSDPSQMSLVPDGVRVHRIDTPFTFGRNPGKPPTRGFASLAWWRARSYAEWLFIVHDWSWNWGVAAAKALTTDPEFAHTYDAMVVDAPPRPAVVPFMRWARARNIPALLDLRDKWAWHVETRPGPFDLRPTERRRRWGMPLREEAITTAAHVVLTSPQMADLMRGHFPGLPPAHFSSIPNAFMDVDRAPADPGERRNGHLRIVYTGSLAYGRLGQAEALLRGMAELRRRGGPEVDLIIAAPGGDSLDITARDEGLRGNLELLGWISRDDAIRVQRQADALLLLQPAEVQVAIPAKLFEYMERRRNILGLVGSSPGAQIIEEYALGVVSAGDDPHSIADALQRLARSVEERRFLPEPPASYSERATVAEFAQRLDTMLARPG
jgi:glycosyltransferase involved in cell wall biosynthesis